MRIRDTNSAVFPANRRKRRSFRRAPLIAVLLVLLAARGLASFARTYTKQPAVAPVQNATQIPVGYVLPAKLERTLSVSEARPGDHLEARIMQEVPLPDRAKVPFRSVVKGLVLAIVRDDDEKGVQLTMSFDLVTHRGQSLPVATSLRALASNMAVHDAQLPLNSSDEVTPLSWANTIQIGGDLRFGDGDSVRSRWKETVGRAVPGGVLVQMKANPEFGCEGPAGRDDHAQAFWLFSADACGVYGLKGVQITRNGQDAPVGRITLHFANARMKLNAGTGLLLQVVPAP